jgi:uracil-DNA glycosylase family 4
MAARSSRPLSDWTALDEAIVACERCSRLREYCRRVAAEKRAAFRTSDYWGRPVPNFGDPRGRLLIVGLAPAAHGGNRTGRVFTGDRSGDWLFRALHKAGFANSPQSISRDDGLQLTDCAVTAALHCAPPDNKPLPRELENCQEWFERTIDVMPLEIFVALGQIAWRTVIAEARRREWHPGPMPKFKHGAQVALAGGRWLLGSYHPSQQNTFTGRLTEAMFDRVFRTARGLLGQR